MTTYTRIPFHLVSDGATHPAEVAIGDLVLAGWSGRDRAAQEAHVVEMEKLGIKRPPSMPVYYRVSSSLVTRADAIEVVGGDSSGEVEFVIVPIGRDLWIGAGSDQTDRKVESYGITVSKQMCEKPMAAELWKYDEIVEHWDRLMLRSWADGVLYQEGPLAAMLTPPELIEGYTGGLTTLPEGTVMFSGTIATRGGLKPSAKFRFELEDPVRKRALRHEYAVRCLPIVG
jgi:hypothetical protein